MCYLDPPPPPTPPTFHILGAYSFIWALWGCASRSCSSVDPFYSTQGLNKLIIIALFLV